MDHDRLCKELLITFFVEFLELFFPELTAYLDPDSIEFLDKELFTDVTQGDRHEADLVVRARFRGQELCFLIHVEAQAQPQVNFARRMFGYFALLHQKYDLPVYPIAVFTYESPQRPEPAEYRVEFPDLSVLCFRFRAVQLNRLAWRDFVNRTNPIAAALMARMHIEPGERVQAKLACLRMVARMLLDPARRELISGFVDSYLQLTIEEDQQFEAELQQIQADEKEGVMEIVTSWMRRGLEEGRQEGRQEGERKVILRQLRKRLGALDREFEDQINALSAERLADLEEALLDFTGRADLEVWLERQY